jgi:predicted CoA-substrate-specific enzyme activase
MTMIVGVDVGSTTVKAIATEPGRVLWQDYRRHGTKQADMVLAFLSRMEDECGLTAGRDRVIFTGSGAGLIAPLVGGKTVQEVVAVAAAVERLHAGVRFVSEIGGEDMKTIFFTPAGGGRTTQVYMQAACSGGTGTFIEKTARKLQVSPEALARMAYHGRALHKVSSKCGIFAEADANTLVKSGVPVEEIIASLFEAVVYQNLATLTKGNTPMPEVLLLGGPNLFFAGLQEAWRHHLTLLWRSRGIALPDDVAPESLVVVPENALYYACLGCVEIARNESADAGVYAGTDRLRWWIDDGQHAQKAKDGARGLVENADELSRFRAEYQRRPLVAQAFRALSTTVEREPSGERRRLAEAFALHRGRCATADCDTHADAPRDAIVGCDFGSTTAKAVVLTADGEVAFSCYALSHGNPIEDAKDLFAQLQTAGIAEVGALAITGYGKDLLADIVGADVAVVETVAHATAALHFHPDADVICDVGGCDVKIMILRQGTVADFRLNSQCSSGNGAFLQGVAERYGIALDEYADRAFAAREMPALAMGCGVFLQSDIVNQQRKGWAAEEIMAALAAVLPVNVWIYAGQLQNLSAAGRKFVLQGGTHRNLAVVKAQVDFIRRKVPGAEIVVHPYSGEAGAIGAALCAREWKRAGTSTRFRGFDAIGALTYTSETSAQTVCHWCPVTCKRTFIDVRLPGAAGRPWSQAPLAAGWARVISGNSCPKGLVEDVHELRVVKGRLEEVKRAFPNIAETVRSRAFRVRAAAV